MLDIKIRKINSNELNKLEDMLYEAIYQNDKSKIIPREVIKSPEISIYIDNFGKLKDDYCLVADLNGIIIGAVWVRIIKAFGNIDDNTPEFAISLYKQYRNQGIGKQLMLAMIDYLKTKGYDQTSLSVQKENYAVKLYKSVGFEIIKENEEDYIMLLKLR